MDSINAGVTSKKIVKSEFLNERHTPDGIQYLYYKLKNGSSASKKVNKIVRELRSEGKSILDAAGSGKPKEYLILDENK
jgi:hypothetical protein